MPEPEGVQKQDEECLMEPKEWLYGRIGIIDQSRLPYD
jgi:hypothetical protein